MSNVKPKVGQVWAKNSTEKQYTMNEADESAIKSQSFFDNYKFIPQNDIEWLAVNVDEWQSIFNQIFRHEGSFGHCEDSVIVAVPKYTHDQWQSTRYELGLDDKPSIVGVISPEQENQEQTKAEVEAEQPKELNEEYLKSCSRDHLLMFSIDMLAQTKYQQGVIDELTSAKTINDVKTPVFTKAMADAGELPPIGSEFLDTYNDDGGDVCTALMHDASKVIYSASSGGEICHFSCLAEYCKPIQTDEEKLRDKFIHFYQKGVNDELCIDDAADELLSEFTITLNKANDA